MKRMWKVLSLALILTGLLGCSLIGGPTPAAPTSAPTESAPTVAPTAVPPTAAATAVPPTAAAEATQPGPGPVPPGPTKMADITSLMDLVKGQLQPGEFDGVAVLPLASLPDQPPLWAVHTYGTVNFQNPKPTSHFVAIYTRNASGDWQELSKLPLEVGPDSISVDYLNQNGVKQVQVEPGRIWLTAEAEAGAHSGVFFLISFDGQQLRTEVQGSNDSPAAGRLEDVNQDGIPEAILNASDNYVFCYACGVRKYAYQVYHWDADQKKMVEVKLSPLGAGMPDAAVQATDQAITLAKAGLWKDAFEQARQALNAAATGQGADLSTLTLNLGIIQVHADALGKAAREGPYPLLGNVFYGDYAAAVELMRVYPAEKIFTAQSPLIVGTVAEQNVEPLSKYTIDSASAAIQVRPDLAAAYFLRGWAEYLKDPADPQAKADVAKAAGLAPEDALFKASETYLNK